MFYILLTQEGISAYTKRQVGFMINFVAFALTIIVVQARRNGGAFAIPFEVIGGG